MSIKKEGRLNGDQAAQKYTNVHRNDSSNSEKHNDAEWPELEPLAAPLDSKLYPIKHFPAALRGAINEVQTRSQAPMALVAASALSAVSLVCQGLIDVQRDGHLFGPASLYLLTIAESGERKSTCDAFFSKTIKAFDCEQAKQFVKDMRDYQAKSKLWEARDKALRRKIERGGDNPQQDVWQAELFKHENNKPIPPRKIRLELTDITPEALAQKLDKDCPIGGVLSSEAGLVFGSYGMSKDTAMRNLSFFNNLWGGDDFHADRKTTGSVSVSNARLTIGLQTQPSVLTAFLHGAGKLAIDNGFLARCLISTPSSTQGNRPYQELSADMPALHAFDERMRCLLGELAEKIAGKVFERSTLLITNQAKKHWIDFYNEVESELKPGGKYVGINDAASKAADNVARIAALFHYFDGNKDLHIQEQYMVSAIELMRWYLYEASRFKQQFGIPLNVRSALTLERWLVGQVENGLGANEILVSDILQYGPNPLRNKTVRDQAIKLLEQEGYIRRYRHGRKTYIELHPDLLRKSE